MFCSLAGELRGEAPTKRANLESKLVGRKAPHCFGRFCGRIRMLEPGEPGQTVSWLLGKAFGGADLQPCCRAAATKDMSSQRLGLPCPTWDVPWQGPQAQGDAFPAGLPSERGEIRVQDGSCGQLWSCLLDLNSSTHRSKLIQGFVKELSMDLFWTCANLLQIQMLGLSLSLLQTSGKSGALSAGCGSLSSRSYQYKLLSYPQDDVTNPLPWLSHSEGLQGFQLHIQSSINSPYYNSAAKKIKCM